MIVSTAFIAGAAKKPAVISSSLRADQSKSIFRPADRPATRYEGPLSFDYADAAAGFRFAAERGESRAQGLLGMFYFDGTGVPQDLIESYKWLSLAATHGDKYVAGMRDSVAAEMTPSQLEQARRLARSWRPAKPSRR